MTDHENKLLQELFAQAAQQQIADNGFSERVMKSLPADSRAVDSSRRLSLLWTWFCIVAGVVCFFAFSGWESLKASLAALFSASLTSLEVLVVTIPTADVHLNPMTILLVLAFVVVYLPYQAARKLSAIR